MCPSQVQKCQIRGDLKNRRTYFLSWERWISGLKYNILIFIKTNKLQKNFHRYKISLHFQQVFHFSISRVTNGSSLFNICSNLSYNYFCNFNNEFLEHLSLIFLLLKSATGMLVLFWTRLTVCISISMMFKKKHHIDTAKQMKLAKK